MAIARYTLAVDRRFKRDGEASASFIWLRSFWEDRQNFTEIFPSGYPYCGDWRKLDQSYTNKDGNKVYTTDVVVESRNLQRAKLSVTVIHHMVLLWSKDLGHHPRLHLHRVLHQQMDL